MSLSVVINTLNEATNLPRALDTVKDLADEIVVVDMESDDDTVRIANLYNAKVYSHKKVGYVEPARNYAISKANSDWVLILDADEEIHSKLANEIVNLTKSNDVDYCYLPRKNIIFGKWLKHTGWWPDYNIRLFKKGSVTWRDEIHSVPETRGVGKHLPEDVDLAIVHHAYGSIGQYIDRMQRYTDAQTENLISSKYKMSWADFITKPSSEFLRRFFLLEGYKDGLHGLVLAGLQAFSELVVVAKFWERSKDFEEMQIGTKDLSAELTKLTKDLNYWKADMNYKKSRKINERIKRKLRIL